MKSNNLHYNHLKLLERLKLEIKNTEGNSCNIYRSFEEIPDILKKIDDVKKESRYVIDPNLPIDLICERKKREVGTRGKQKIVIYYTIYLIISTQKKPDHFENKIQFYKFYLSRIISSKRLKVVLVSLEYTEGIKDEFLKDNGIGLWKFVVEQDKFEKILPSFSQREKMTLDYEEMKPKSTPLFFDRYVHDAVDAIVGVTPEQIGKKYIDNLVMDKIFELENISYRESLIELLNDHLTEKGDEYEFASEVFSMLWEDNICLPYKDFLQKFEPGLQHVFSGAREKSGRIYRDHYLHQFQVFLLGLFVIDKLYEKFTKKYVNPEICWLLISSFHDMAYPVQLYDEWSGQFFNNIFNVSKEIGYMELKSNFVDRSFMSCMSFLITRLCSVLLKETVGCNWVTEKNDLVLFFYKKITEAKNHSILSSISLLKMIQDPKYREMVDVAGLNSKDVLMDIFVPSALAIALHDDEIWGDLKNLGKLKKQNCLPVLKFEDDPLSFLLIYCDSVQEWGRPSKSMEVEENKALNRFFLKDLEFDPQEGFNVTLRAPNHLKTDDFFKRKQTELRKIESFLKQPSYAKFTIRLEDKNHKGEDFEMQCDA